MTQMDMLRCGERSGGFLATFAGQLPREPCILLLRWSLRGAREYDMRSSRRRRGRRDFKPVLTPPNGGSLALPPTTELMRWDAAFMRVPQGPTSGGVVGSGI